METQGRKKMIVWFLEQLTKNPLLSFTGLCIGMFSAAPLITQPIDAIAATDQAAQKVRVAGLNPGEKLHIKLFTISRYKKGKYKIELEFFPSKKAKTKFKQNLNLEGPGLDVTANYVLKKAKQDYFRAPARIRQSTSVIEPTVVVYLKNRKGSVIDRQTIRFADKPDHLGRKTKGGLYLDDIRRRKGQGQLKMGSIRKGVEASVTVNLVKSK